MTSANISNMLAKQSAAVSNASKNSPVANRVDKKDDTQEVFSNVMNQTQADNTVAPGITDTRSDVSKVGTDNRNEQQKLPSRADNRQIQKADDTRDTSAIKDKLADKTDDFAKDVKDVIEEELDVTDEEIEEAMANLGLSMLDLTDPANLSQLVAELSNSVDQTELLMSDGFLNIMQQVETLTGELMQDLGIDADQLKLMIGELQQPTEEVGIATDIGEMPQMNADASEVIAEESSVQTAGELQTKDSSVTTEQAMANQTVNPVTENTDDTVMSQEPAEQAAEQTTEEAVQTKQGDTNADTNSGDSNSELMDSSLRSQRQDSAAGTDNHNVGQFVQTMDATVQTPQTAPVTNTPQVDVESIMRQIVEFSKTVINQSGTTLEMQLNPENLGKIYMQISTTREGNVTAQLTAQNEAVKEALESQVATLRENLNQQGVKVDAIEVTVSTHEFERNLEQNASSQEQQGEQQEAGRRSGRRNLNLDSLDELSGLMSEEEVLAARIMQQNGNSMDVTA